MLRPLWDHEHVALGKFDRRLIAGSVSEGDVIIYKRFGGTEVTVDGEDYVLVEEDSILAIRS